MSVVMPIKPRNQLHQVPLQVPPTPISLFQHPSTLQKNQQNQQNLDIARDTWESQGPAVYAFVYHQFGNFQFNGPITVSVVDGSVDSAVYADAEGSEVLQERMETLPTFDELFETIQEAISGRAFSITVTYNGLLGYPEKIHIDYDQMIVDEEFSVIVALGTETLEPDQSTGLPTSAPTEATNLQSPEFDFLMKAYSSSYLQSGAGKGGELESKSKNFVLEQMETGVLRLSKKGTGVVWESEIFDQNEEEHFSEEYFSHLMQDGSLVTKKGTIGMNTKIVWNSGVIGPDSEYFLAVDLANSLLVIYEGTVESPLNLLWKATLLTSQLSPSPTPNLSIPSATAPSSDPLTEVPTTVDSTEASLDVSTDPILTPEPTPSPTTNMDDVPLTYTCTGASTANTTDITNPEPVPVNFQYIIFASSEASSTLIDHIEETLIKAVIAAGFCSRRLESFPKDPQNHRHLASLAEVSSSPKDEMEENGYCGQNCYIINGGMTVTPAEEGTADEVHDIKCSIIAIVRNAMQDITSSTFLESDTVCSIAPNGIVYDNPGIDSSSSSSSDVSSLPVEGKVGIGLAAATLIGLSMFVLNRKKQGDNDKYGSIKSKSSLAEDSPLTIDTRKTMGLSSTLTSAFSSRHNTPSLMSPMGTGSNVSSAFSSRYTNSSMLSPMVMENGIMESEGIEVFSPNHFTVNDSCTDCEEDRGNATLDSSVSTNESTINHSISSPRNLGIASPEDINKPWDEESTLSNVLFALNPALAAKGEYERSDEGKTTVSNELLVPISKTRLAPPMTPIKETNNQEADRSLLYVSGSEGCSSEDYDEEAERGDSGIGGKYLPTKYNSACKPPRSPKKAQQPSSPPLMTKGSEDSI